MSFKNLQVGDCIVNISLLPEDENDVEVVPCSVPHEAEVYATSPSVAADKDSVRAFCMDNYKAYIGVDWNDSKLSMMRAWNGAKSTTAVQCLVYDENVMVTSSYKGSKA